MKSPLNLALALLPTTTFAAFGNQYYTGPVANSNQWIREFSTTLILPPLNNPQTDNLSIWPGIQTEKGDLVQALAISSTDGGGACKAGSTPGQWCIVASTLPVGGSQLFGKGLGASPGTHVDIHYVFNDSTQKYDQNVIINGKVVSTLSTMDGHATRWYMEVECQKSGCGTAPAHTYTNTRFVLNAADSTYNQRVTKTGSSGDMSTSDGGKTWTVPTIQIQASTSYH